MSRRWFGTDGIRGRVGSAPISADFVLRLGNAYGHALCAERTRRGVEARKPLVVIGKDTRISNYMFEAALEAGLVAAGVNVELMGPMPTPAVAHLTRALRADGGIVISASHNPHFDNGIKFFSANGEKLDDATELAIEAALEQPFSTVSSEILGKAVRTRDAIGRYVEACKNSVPRDFDLADLHIVVDCAHGASYQVAPLVLSELGARVEAIGVEPNGTNINAGVGSLYPDAVARHVISCGAELGIAFDGDGDRLLFVDAEGRRYDGDDLLYLLALDWQQSGRLRGPVVGTLMTNYGLEQALAAAGIGFVRAKVGDRYVHQALVEHGGILGGEASGHLLCLDRATTGDGIISALQVLEVLQRRKLTLPQALADLRKFPQKTVNVQIASGARPVETASVQQALAEAQRAVAGRGRAFLRPSGTEPVVRVTVEADETELVETVVQSLADAVRSAANAASCLDTTVSKTPTMSHRIPTLDIRRFTHAHSPADRAAFVTELGQTYQEWGFAGIRNHGIAAADIDAAYRVFQAFFALPEATKRQYHIPGGGGARGYTPFGVETAKDSAYFDLKEFWHIGRELDDAHADRSAMPANLWPAEIPGFRAHGYGLYQRLDALGATVLSALALYLDLPEDWFQDKIDHGNSILRPIHYPPITTADIPNVRAGAHEDINLITLLVGASAAGLEVLSRQGEWVPFTSDADTIVVNIGDMLQRLTNHVYPSTTHRVVNPPGALARQPRYSVPFFLHPNPEFLIDVLPSCITPDNPNRYPEPITAQGYLEQRLREIKLK